MCGGNDAPAEYLTGRELLALQLLARGYSIARIAAVLIVPSWQVAALLARATVRLGARDQREAVARARQRRLIL
ncbi:MAG TPA: hypothetical protein VGW38_17130 [Chloroflexota bacterium]|nr:hypothetical protein [Chloroflexota bacterium]